MTQSPKVVHLSAVEAVAGRNTRSLPPILLTVRQNAKKTIVELVQTLFNNVDDALFEMADRSRNDADQNMYFDSMRELRLQRKHVVTGFSQRFADGFDTLIDAPKRTDATADESNADSMVLLKNDELEVSVAVSGIVSKITSRFSLPVMQLTRRIDSVCPGREVAERTNPLGPRCIAEAFVAATDDLVLDIRARIIVLKLFERFVMEELGPVYEDANRVMADAGVLADLRTPARRNTSTPSPKSAPAHTGAATAGSMGHRASPHADDGFSMLQGLLSADSGGEVGGSTRPGYGRRATAGPMISTQDLMTALSAVQTDVSSAPLDIDHAPAPIDLHALVLSRAVGVIGAANGNMARADEDTVNLVGMLFDYILNDRNLAIPMKALIARLQIPMLKVAVLDKSFFSKPSHGARQLLNELSSAGIGWSSSAELKRDSLYNKIESVVLRVLNNFADDPAIFDKL
ncbi:MAG: DUF1631 domain-containing protein, partial [Gammaproteobacteria bacterium]|nr:DUF1631 domain-containing protein [Gammaproteobacteria bacterium]